MNTIHLPNSHSRGRCHIGLRRTTRPDGRRRAFTWKRRTSLEPMYFGVRGSTQIGRTRNRRFLLTLVQHSRPAFTNRVGRQKKRGRHQCTIGGTGEGYVGKCGHGTGKQRESGQDIDWLGHGLLDWSRPAHSSAHGAHVAPGSPDRDLTFLVTLVAEIPTRRLRGSFAALLPRSSNAIPFQLSHTFTLTHDSGGIRVLRFLVGCRLFSNHAKANLRQVRM